MKERTCRVCGCTAEDCRQCIKATGAPCHWVQAHLCSACDLAAPPHHGNTRNHRTETTTPEKQP